MKRTLVHMSIAVVLILAARGTASAQAPVAVAPVPNAQDLDAMVGHWIHRGRTPEGELLVVKRVCERTLDDHYLAARTQVQVAGQTVLVQQHMVRWDPVRKQNRSWVFSSNGDFVHGAWKQASDHQTVGKLVGQTADGKRKTAVATYNWVDNDTYIYRLTQRVTGGQSLPDYEWDFHRVDVGQ